jgi:hypothetical protein
MKSPAASSDVNVTNYEPGSSTIKKELWVNRSRLSICKHQSHRFVNAVMLKDEG